MAFARFADGFGTTAVGRAFRSVANLFGVFSGCTPRIHRRLHVGERARTVRTRGQAGSSVAPVPRRATFEIVSGWVEDVGCAPTRITLQGNLELASPFPRLKPNYATVGSGCARVRQTVDGFRLTATGHDVRLNDARVHETILKQGDVLTWGDVTLRFEEHEAHEHREPRLEGALIAAPDDEALWQVYGDWLMSLGEALGERSNSLGHLAPLVTEHGALTLEWSHGFIRSAVLRAWGSIQLDDLLVWLLDLPASRFIRSIEIELRSFIAREDGEERHEAVLNQAQRVLQHAELPALDRLVLGPLFIPVNPEVVNVVRPRRAPRLPPPGPYGFLMLKNDAWLEIDRGLEARGPLVQGQSVQLYASPQLMVGSVYWNDGWCLFSAPLDDARQTLTLNGKTPSSWQPLRDGDVLESGESLRIRFRT